MKLTAIVACLVARDTHDVISEGREAKSHVISSTKYVHTPRINFTDGKNTSFSWKPLPGADTKTTPHSDARLGYRDSFSSEDLGITSYPRYCHAKTLKIKYYGPVIVDGLLLIASISTRGRAGSLTPFSPQLEWFGGGGRVFVYSRVTSRGVSWSHEDAGLLKSAYSWFWYVELCTPGVMVLRTR
ncbi:hypothetical protein RRG08_008507 [Elysia crispata]|uniref:Uncharacterized protein n=1 Tax=Elysia crispata TaxID=231223 RepID=A0AAE0Z8G6_9GAST|nr:hypothetical protein RRG08_008507 [Elysia crispata]